MSKSTFVKSTLILTVATLLSKILGSIFRIPLQNIAGDEVLGIFSLVYPVYMVALILSVAGIPIAISKLIAEARSKDDQVAVRQIYVTASILGLLFGVTSFTLIASFSGPIANLLGGPETRLALIVVAATLLVAPYMAVYRGFFQGYENMQPTAVSQVIEQFIRVGLIIGVAYFLVSANYSNEIVAGGVMIGSIVGAIGSLIYLRIKFVRARFQMEKGGYSFAVFRKRGKQILMVSLPIAVGAITMALMNFVDSFTIPIGLRSAGVASSDITHLYGIYGRGQALVQIATVFATSVVLPLIPLLTKKLVEKDYAGTRDVMERTHRMTHLLSWPAAFGLLALTLPLNLALFTNLEGSLVLAIIGASSVFTSFTLLGTGILQGMNVAKTAAGIIVGGVVLKTLFNIGLIQFYGLNGAALATLLVYFVLFGVNTYFIYKQQAFRWFSSDAWKMIFASIVMGAVIGIPTLYFDISSWTRLSAMIYVAGAIVIGVGIYFALLYVMKVNLNLRELRKSEGAGASSPPPMKTKGGSTVNKKKWIFVSIIVLLIVSLPGIFNRWQVESNYDTYEVAIPYHQIKEMTLDGAITTDEALTSLKEAGLQAVSLNPISLKTLDSVHTLSIFEHTELEDLLRFNNVEHDITFGEKGYYITMPTDSYYVNVIQEHFQVEERHVKDETLFFLPNAEKADMERQLTYDENVMEQLKEHGIAYFFRAENTENEEEVAHITEELLAQDLANPRILFSGLETFGTPSMEETRQFAETFTDAGFTFYRIEDTDQKGMQMFTRVADHQVIRLHSLTLGIEELEERIDRSVRAVKERNIGTLYVNLYSGQPTSSQEILQEGVDYLTTLQKEMPSHYQNGIANPIESFNVPFISLIASILAGILLTYLAAGVLNIPKLQIVAGLFMVLVALGYFVTGKLALLQGFALIVSLAAPIYAIIESSKEGSKNIGKILLQLLKAVGISFIGILIIVGVLNGNEFVTGTEQFRGVKLLSVGPIVFVAFYFLWMQRHKANDLNAVVTTFNTPVRYWHLAIMLIIGAVGYYYITRTGNAGEALEIELMFRQALEELLYVRPRTKEFLIGFPLFVLALYVMSMNKNWGRLLLIPGVIGFASIVNTFSHFHIPLSISLLRTAYSVAFGFIIGVVLIYIFKFLWKIISKYITKKLAS